MADVAIAHATSPFVSAYPWDAGFGTKYADPGTLPASTGNGIEFADADVAIAHTTTPFVSAYPWSAGFGSKYTNPGTLPASTGRGVAFSPDGATVAIAHSTSPRVSAYPWSAGFGSKYSNPGTLPTGDGYGVAFAPDGASIAVAHATSPFISGYPWSAGFGSKYSNPGTLPATQGSGVAIHPNGDRIAVVATGSPYVQVYTWTSMAAKDANPGTLPAGAARGVAWSPNGQSIAVGHDASPYVSAYPYTASGGFGTKLSDPATLPATNGTAVSFSDDGAFIGVVHGISPRVSAYPWNGQAGFGTKLGNPGTVPAGTPGGIAFTRPTYGASQRSNSGATSVAWDHTVTAGTTMLVVAIGTRNGPVTDVTWDGSPMTLAVRTTGSGIEAEIWYVANPTAKRAEIEVTCTLSSSAIHGGAINLNGPTIRGAVAQGAGFFTSISRSPASKAGDIVVDILSGPDNGSGNTPTPNSGQHMVLRNLLTDARAAMSVKESDGAVTMGWTTIRNEDWRYAVAVFSAPEETSGESSVAINSSSSVVAEIPPYLSDGPHVYYPEGRMGTSWVLAFTATGPTDTLNWQVWTGPNRSGVMIGSGTCEKDTPTAVRFDGGVPTGETSTLYLTVDDDV